MSVYTSILHLPEELQTDPYDQRRLFYATSWRAVFRESRHDPGELIVTWALRGNRVTKDGKPYRRQQQVVIRVPDSEIPATVRADVRQQAKDRRTAELQMRSREIEILKTWRRE